MRNTKAAGDDDVPVAVLKLQGEDDIRLMAELIGSLFEMGEWPQDIT